MIGVLDYGMGNLSSVTNALEYLGIENVIINDEAGFDNVSHLIIPGVGSFGKAMENMAARNFISQIHNFNKKELPILGICLGMQLLAEIGTEPTECSGLGIIKGRVEYLPSQCIRVPHVGWNGIEVINDHPILEDVKRSVDFYFVHSYRFVTAKQSNIIAETNYGVEFPTIVSNDQGNVVGIQFHPEKSQKQGLQILTNFSKLNA
jgi:glutamine amidotransferase